MQTQELVNDASSGTAPTLANALNLSPRLMSLYSAALENRNPQKTRISPDIVTAAARIPRATSFCIMTGNFTSRVQILWKFKMTHYPLFRDAAKEYSEISEPLFGYRRDHRRAGEHGQGPA